MKRSQSYLLILALVSLLLANCGGGAAPSDTPPPLPTSKIAKRAFVLNQFAGKISIVDAAIDVGSFFVVPQDQLAFFVNGEFMVRAGARTLVYDSGNNFVHLIDNATEDRIAAVGLQGFSESIVVNAENTIGYAAIPSLGRINVIDITAGKLLDSINGIPGVRRVVLSKNGTKLLAFSNDVSTMVVVNVSDKTLTTVSGLDRPYTAVFSGDDSKAFILNCGAECGGGAAKVTVLDMSNNTLGSSVAVGGATVGLLDGTNLYVAGSPAVSTATTNGGRVNVVSVSNTAALTTGTAVTISDGTHHVIALAGTKLYIGAKRCRNIENGCLSFFNTSASTATISLARGDVTSIAPIKNRTVVYVTEGGELDIYSTASDTLQTTQVNFSGKIVDAKEVD